MYFVYSCVRSYQKTEWCKITFLSHSFCGAGIWRQLSLTLRFGVSLKAVSRWWPGLLSSQNSTREDQIPSSLRWMLAGFSFWLALLAVWDSTQGRATTAACSIRTSKKNRREHSTNFQISGATSIAFALFESLEANHWVVYTQGEEIAQSVWIPGGRCLWEPF